MASEQTGFSGSPPAAARDTTGRNGNSEGLEPTGRATSPPAEPDSIQPKEEPIDLESSPVASESLPAITEENWRTYYQQQLADAQPTMIQVSTGEDQAVTVHALYEAYKLPPLLKFKCTPLSAVWNTNVTSAESSPLPLLAAADDDGPATTQPSDLPPGDIYLREPTDKEDASTTVICADTTGPSSVHVSEVEDAPSTAGDASPDDKDNSLPCAPSAVKVKQSAANAVGQDPDVDLGAADSDPSGAMQTETTTSTDLPIESATYPTTGFSPAPSSYEQLGTGQYSVLTNVVVSAAPPQYGTQPSTVYTVAPADYYRDFYQYQGVVSYAESVDSACVERYIRQSYKPGGSSLNADLPSPDSGIGEATVTPRDTLPQMFDYSELSQTHSLLQSPDNQTSPSGTRPASTQPSSPSRKASWNEYSRNAESDKVQIPKIFSDVGFRYFMETPTSTSQRREDDRMTYINKGQYYGLTLEYIPDPERPLRSNTVRSVVMLMFREEKSPEDELKAWKFWHGRQHSIKQRILDADTKNSCGIVGQIEELAHNSVAFYWSPLESSAKVSVSVHCLSTDFSNQKGVKGLPLHIQIDTFDDIREGATPIHRGYCQIKVFCDKGAERKTRDEERRATKRKLTATGSGRKRIEEMYHPPYERSEFYSMSDLLKPPILFSPTDDADQTSGPELTFFPITSQEDHSNTGDSVSDIKTNGEVIVSPPIKRFRSCPPMDRVLLYAKRVEEEVFHPLHLVPPSLAGLCKAIETKYNIEADAIRNIYKRCKKGITVEMDDDIVRHYCNEDTFIVDVNKVDDKYDIVLVEL